MSKNSVFRADSRTGFHRPGAIRRSVRIGQCVVGLMLFVLATAQARGQNKTTLALLPFENVSGNINGVRLIMPIIERSVREKGYQIVDPDKIESFLSIRRIRNTGMLSRSQLDALRQEFGVDLALVGSVDLFFESDENPQWGLSSRIVSTENAKIVWAESSGRTGGDYTKVLGLGTITSANSLAEEVTRILFQNLPRAGGAFPSPQGSGLRMFRLFGPPRARAGYRSKSLDSAARLRVAVLPFENVSERPGAGRILTDILTTALFQHGRFDVMDPGEVQEALIQLGIFPYGGIDNDTLAQLRRRTGVDALFLGTLYGYTEGLQREATTSPEVSLDLRLIQIETSKTLWFADGTRKGDDYRIALDFGIIRPMVSLVMKVLDEILETL
jgi:TolB-like protein